MENVLYCKKCRILTIHDRCHNCGNRKIKKPNNNDEVFLVQLRHANIAEGMLNDHEILFYRKAIGFNMVGQPRPPYDFFVRVDQFERASELVKTLVELDKE